MAKELTEEEKAAKRLEEEKKAKRLAEAQKYMEEGLSSAEYKEPQSLNSSSNKSALSNFFKETEATKPPEGKNISLNKDMTLPSITGKKTVSKDIEKFAKEYNPQKNTALVNALVDANALKKLNERQAQPDIAPALTAQRASEASVPSVSKVAGEEDETTKPATETKEALKKAYAVVFSGDKKNKNQAFSSLEEANNYYKEQGGTKGGIITLTDNKKSPLSAYDRASKIAYGEINDSPEYREELKQTLRGKGKQALIEAKKARELENAKNKASFQKFQESVGSDKQALDAYNEYNKDQSLLRKAYNAALQKGNYGAAIKIKDQISRTSANVPVEMGQRQKYFREQAPVERKSSIERETLRRKKEADDLAMFEKNKKANESYMASNTDAVLNQPTQVKEPSDDEDSYLDFGTPFRSRR